MSIGENYLPECLIEKIFSYLSYKEATKLSLVSKTWLQAWFTCPNLKFKVHDDGLFVDKVMERYRERKIPIDKFTLSISCYKSHRDLGFRLFDKWLDIALQNGVKDVVCEVDLVNDQYPFPISTFLASKSSSLRDLELAGCDLMKNVSLLSITTTKCHSLRKLSLYDVRLDDNMLQTLIDCCPFIVDLTIQACPLLTKIEVTKNLQNIKSVCISTSFSDRISSVKIQAPTLQHLSYSRSRVLDHVSDIIECPNLKSLELSCMKVSERLLRYLMKVSEVLETLILYYVRGEWNESFNICCSHQSLKDLKIVQYSKHKIIGVIDAPNLVSIEYVGGKIPHDLKFAKESTQLNNSQANIRCYSELIDATWFLKLRKFLSNSTSWSRISLRFNELNEIDMKDLQLRNHMHIPQVIVLDVHLKFKDIITSSCPVSFVDALLWSCRSRRLNLYSTSVEIITCFMDRLMYMKNSSHSTSQLKQVKAYKFISEQYETVELIVVKNWP